MVVAVVMAVAVSVIVAVMAMAPIGPITAGGLRGLRSMRAWVRRALHLAAAVARSGRRTIVTLVAWLALVIVAHASPWRALRMALN